ncbi:hypothetical protein [Hyphomicrobium sp. D-2]|uniref:hypothetical protein n=1 Tax=Hyphomicrobium sp. D-2 TaxID=3041621 RepID=UPI0024538EBB|nr:hypothetical protein [Hyphomicrobium sp. D-2]MDH4980982.1 hypothetical protein [Hyphomicrobium sp. D-2]
MLLAATLALAPIGTAAFADTHIPAATAQSKATTKADGKASAVAAADATGESTSVTTGSINQEPTYAQRMAECVQIWDRGTHMTRKQWRRSCQETLRSLKW